MESSPAYPARLQRNQLLAAIAEQEFASLLDSAEPLELEARKVLYEANAPIRDVYFLDRGVASIIAPVGYDASVEVGTIGYEGFVGLPLLLGGDRESTRAIIQVPGNGWKIPAAVFRAATDESATLRNLLLRYVQSYLHQVSQCSACNRAHSIEERCARWLLMTHDRVDTDTFALTHEFLAVMLGVRRAGVTVAAGALQKAGLIEYSRGHIRILNRPALEEASCPCYGIIRSGYPTYDD